jgi:hypothetical protein
MARSPYAFILDGKKKVRLGKFDPHDTAGLEKKEGLARLQALPLRSAHLPGGHARAPGLIVGLGARLSDPDHPVLHLAHARLLSKRTGED